MGKASRQWVMVLRARDKTGASVKARKLCKGRGAYSDAVRERELGYHGVNDEGVGGVSPSDSEDDHWED